MIQYGFSRNQDGLIGKIPSIILHLYPAKTGILPGQRGRRHFSAEYSAAMLGVGEGDL
jgi:hypothetical protein